MVVDKHQKPPSVSRQVPPSGLEGFGAERVCAVDPGPGEGGVVEVVVDVVDNGHDAGHLPGQACDDGGRGSPSDSAGECRHPGCDIDLYLVGADPHDAPQDVIDDVLADGRVWACVEAQQVGAGDDAQQSAGSSG